MIDRKRLRELAEECRLDCEDMSLAPETVLALLDQLYRYESALKKIGGTDEIFEKTEFILCACEESHAYMQMNRRRRDTAREALNQKER